MQGGPHNATTAAIAVTLGEALKPEFKEYAKKTVENAKCLASELMSLGFNLISGGTDNHLMLIDLTNKGVTGKVAAVAMEKAGIVLNYNTVPGETRKASAPSGIRLGTPSVTSRGFGFEEMKKIAFWMNKAVANTENEETLVKIASEAANLCANFPVPGIE